MGVAVWSFSLIRLIFSLSELNTSKPPAYYGLHYRFGSFCAILGAQKGSGFALLKKRFAALRMPNAGQDIFA
ncbi:hypothetical protein HMPREF9554_03073 [Treponema phagedenis F0421]|nr:hypothetical protein HMPREF9554_03073 [Treponema phagedenis F0421]